LTAYWNLDETSGTRYDSVGSNDLTDNNTVTSRTGKNNNAADFDDANSECLNIASVGVDLQPTSSVAISLWVYPDDVVGDKILFYCQSNGPLIKLEGSDLFSSLLQSTLEVKAVAGTGVMTSGAWQHLAICVDNGVFRLYRNGASVGTPETYNNTLATGVSAYVSSNGSAKYHDGGIDEVGFWKDIEFADTAAMDAFASALYNSGSGRFYS